VTGEGLERPVVASFDVDGTLTTADCVRPFLRRVGGRRGVLVAVARRPIAALRALARRDRDHLKEIVAGGVLRGREVAEVAALGRSFAAHVEASMLRADVVERLRWHQAHGHVTVIVSASLRPYLEPLGAALGVDAVLCTDVVSAGGRYTDRLDGGNCRGPEKAVRLAAWLGSSALDAAEIWAYGDSSGDRELLAMAHRPQWVRRATVLGVPDGARP